MIKKWFEFIKESNNYDSIISSKMDELEDLISDIKSNYSLIYEWESDDDHRLIINFTFEETNIKYDFDIDDLILIKYFNSKLDFENNVQSLDDGLEIIEKDIQSILGINERKKSEYYKGKKIPGKYLTGPHPKKMKKEIDTFRGKKTYKKDWDADYKSGKGGVGKRVKTKKSAATKAFHKMFGDE